MGQVRHGSAKTTHAVRAAIQRSQASLAQLSKELGINAKTVAKWRKRQTVEDLKTGPKEPRSTVLTEAEEATIIAFRRQTLLPLDDCLYALHRGLTNAGLDVVLMETRQVKGALKAMPIKTDRRDAEGIARLLHLGWFRPVHCKSVSAQEVRVILSARKAIQQNMLALEMSLRGLLRNFGLKVGAISRGRFEHRIRELADGNAMLEMATSPMLRARASLRQELAGLERLVRQMAQDDPVCVRLMTMPGIGAVVALTYRSAVDDPARFTSSKNVGPWVGLTPSRNQSGERDVSGGITKAGDVNLRRALCQAATVMMNRGRAIWLRNWGAQIAKRRGRKRAMVALARRISVILHRMWVDGTTFRMDAAQTT